MPISSQEMIDLKLVNETVPDCSSQTNLTQPGDSTMNLTMGRPMTGKIEPMELMDSGNVFNKDPKGEPKKLV
jgi:hypothetical protein